MPMPRPRKWKYRHKIAAIIFVFALAPALTIGAFFFAKVWNGKVEDILASSRTQLDGGAAGIDSLLVSMTEKMLYINNNYYLINYLETSTDHNLIGIMSFSDYLQSVIGAIKADNSQIDVAIYALKDTNYDGEYLRSIQGLENVKEKDGTSLLDEILAIRDVDLLWKVRTLEGSYLSGDEELYLHAYKKIVSLKRPLAVIEIRVPFKRILPLFQQDMPPGAFIVFDDGRTRTAIKSALDEPPAFGEPVTEEWMDARDEAYYVLSSGLTSNIGELRMFIPKKRVFAELRGYLVSVAAIFVLILAFLFIAVEAVAYLLTKRMETLVRSMNANVETLIARERLPGGGTNDEFGTMDSIFYELTVKIKEYYHRISEYELEKKRLETELLQERFNPHFLYNTLSTMKWISEDQRIRDTVDSMVRYYRIALNKGSSIITIAQEMELIAEYLRLQKFAYGYDFEFQLRTDGDVGRCLVLKHLLQPVVENAVLHGLNGRETGGSIAVCALCEDDGCVRFEISDNGEGIPPDKLEQIVRGPDDSDRTSMGYGMKNVQKRIETFYGPDYGMTIASEPGKGTTVSLRIPGYIRQNAL